MTKDKPPVIRTDEQERARAHKLAEAFVAMLRAERISVALLFEVGQNIMLSAIADVYNRDRNEAVRCVRAVQHMLDVEVVHRISRRFDA